MNSKVLLSFLLTFSIIQSPLAQYDGYSSKNWKKQIEIEKEFLGHIDLNSFKKHLKKLTERPHVVGSKENEKVQNYMANVMKMQVLKLRITLTTFTCQTNQEVP